MNSVHGHAILQNDFNALLQPSRDVPGLRRLTIKALSLLLKGVRSLAMVEAELTAVLLLAPVVIGALAGLQLLLAD